MRIRVLLAGLLVLGAVQARAENPYSCEAGTVKRLKFDRGRMKLSFTGDFVPPAGFDPTLHGLTLDLWSEPETDPGNQFFSVTLPDSSFTVRGSGQVRYQDPTGAVGGITLVKITRLSSGQRRFVVKRKGAAITTPPGGVFRLVFTSGSGCMRSCGSSCSLLPSGNLACKKSSDTVGCGVRSGCDLINASGGHCLLPYPSTFFERDDATTPTGKRLDYQLLAMPPNNNGIHIGPDAWNAQLDGFSPGTMMMANFPQGVDPALSNLNTWQDYTPSIDTAHSPTILLDYDTGEVIEHFAEPDISVGPNGTVAPPNQALIIRPGRRLKNGGHYIIAIRNLVAIGGGAIPPDPAFQGLRDNTPTGNHQVEVRRPAFETIFSKLAAAGVSRSNLILAWDFDVASDFALEHWLLHMRNETLQPLGASAPPFTVTGVTENFSAQVCRQVRGTFDVPLYTTFDGVGSVLNIDPLTDLPVANGVVHAPFTVDIPCSLTTPTPTAGRPTVYGHGLLGSGQGEVSAGHLQTLGQNYGFVFGATDWQGMSQADTFAILFSITPDLTNFRELSERLHQGILNTLVLAHLMGAPDGLAADPHFIYGGQSVIDTSEVYYYGNSQGGILGGSFMSLSTEVTRGVLGVPAANFSTLLQRSVDFEPYFQLLRQFYPNDLDRAFVYPLIQQLWDKSEPNGWYHHTISDPLPGTPAHTVLVHMSTGDAEVSNVATEIMVRTMGMPQVMPVIKHYYNIPEVVAPLTTSAMVEVNGGYPPIPIGNIPPSSATNGAAHSLPRNTFEIQEQIDQFLQPGGDVQQFCTGPCDPH
jgi:hypothetical protein